MDNNLDNHDSHESHESNSRNDWVDDRLGDLSLPANWQPDSNRAYQRLRRRDAEGDPQRRLWAWVAVPVTACLIVLAVTSVRGVTGSAGQPAGTNEAPEASASVGSATAVSAPQVGPLAAVFQGENTLVRPDGYREWVFVGSSLGLSYDDVPEEVATSEDDLFHNVYIDPVGYERFQESGEFADGTVMILELATAAVKTEPGLQGMYEDRFVALEASVRDSSRFEGDWAYFSFTERGGGMKDTAEPFDQENCWKCHNENAETDMVFTQFYPVLRARGGD
jgi:hypothetical protein